MKIEDLPQSLWKHELEPSMSLIPWKLLKTEKEKYIIEEDKFCKRVVIIDYTVLVATYKSWRNLILLQ